MRNPHDLFEVTARCIQERFLLKPSKTLNRLVLGVLGRALSLYPSIRLYAFKVMSNHFHFILSAKEHRTLSQFMDHVMSNIAREAGRLYNWRDKFWSRRYRAIAIDDMPDLYKRLHYMFSHGCKENLVDSPLKWPGASSERAMCFGERLEGVWYDRAGFYEAERKGNNCRLEDFAIRYEVPLSPLPGFEDLSGGEARSHFRGLLEDIRVDTWQRHADEGTAVLGREAILSQDPHDAPRESKRSTAPLCHASSRRRRQAFKRAYQKFVSAYRQASAAFRSGVMDVVFPEGCFPPPPAYCCATGGTSPP